MKSAFRLPLAIALVLLGSSASAQAQEVTASVQNYPTDPAVFALFYEQLRESTQLEKEARGQLKASNTKQAIITLEKLLTLIPTDEDRVLLADIYSRLGKPGDVIRVMKPVILEGRWDLD